MSTIKYVKATIVQRNSVLLLPALGGTPLVRDIDCENVEIQGVEYLYPFSTNGIVESYRTRKIDIGTQTPPADAIRTLRLHDSKANDNIWIAIADNQDESDFAEFCNQCCGATNDYTFSGTYPAPLEEEAGCADTETTPSYTYTAPVPANPFSLNISLRNFTYNGGTPPSVALTAGGYASLAALVTWLNSNLGALGTWSGPSGQLKLVSTNVTSIDLDIELIAKVWCMPLPATPFTADTLVVKDAANADYDVAISALTVSRPNALGVKSALEAHMVGTFTVVSSGSPATNHIEYLGTQKPVKLTDGTNHADFSAGAC